MAKERRSMDLTKSVQSSSTQAFAPTSGHNANRLGRRAAEKDQTRLHVPLVNRTPDDLPPPIIVAIVGKSTPLGSLVRRYTRGGKTKTDNIHRV
ncbi:hypothetical protein HHX47_DHR2000714 [Lentinula edodes]|nr:hypothetical protein HHX47_DHR2000714 [Lentinula edodes]